MGKLETKEILEKVRSGEISIEEAERHFKKQPYEEMGFAKLDVHREVRTGFPEVIYCAGKQMIIWYLFIRKCLKCMVKYSEREPVNINTK